MAQRVAYLLDPVTGKRIGPATAEQVQQAKRDREHMVEVEGRWLLVSWVQS
jgi:hypothetical protein